MGGMPKLSLRVNREQRKLPEMDFWLLSARPTPPRMLLKRLALSLNNLTVPVVSLNKISEGKAVKAMTDAARLAEELRAEQDVAAGFERERKLLECQVKDCQTRLDDSEANALKGGKKAMNKMETRIRELESEVDAEQRRMGDATKNLRKSE